VKITMLALTIACGVAVVGCGMIPPSESEARQVLQDDLGEKIVVLEFEKTDGQSIEVFGVKGYNFKFEGKVRVDSTYMDALKPYLSNDDPQKGVQADKYFSQISMVYDQISGRHWISDKAGTITPVNGTISFSRSENGWTGHVATAMNP